jgi:uncharacterized membrane protein YidH (DUF202 family)
LISRDHLANTVLAMFIAITTYALWSLSEKRFDLYISMYTLEYIIVKAVFRPRRVIMDVLAVGLIIVFFAIVSIRIYEVLIK